MCLGTGAMGIGEDVRHASLRTRAGMLAGRTIPTPSTAAVMAVANEGLDRFEFWPSADAQQLSACACVTTRSDPELCESPLCIGHSWPSEQQAMRASAVANQPAHTAAFPARSPAAKRTADRRRITFGTGLGCWSQAGVSNPGANGRALPRSPTETRYMLMVSRTGASQVQDDEEQRETERGGANHLDPSG
jgi:hypothetical protein